MGEIIARLMAFQIVTEIIGVTIGAGLCFGALKWRRGLLTSTAIAWGLVLGFIMAMFVGEIFGEIGAIICIFFGVVGLPILTYVSPPVNRFVLGFLVACKLLFMLTTALAKDGTIGLEEALVIPFLGGAIVGVLLMLWAKASVSAFVLGCSFIGASQIAPIISEWVNRILFSVTGDITYLFDPIDIFFALFKIELTDWWTFFGMVGLMALGVYNQLKRLKGNNIPFDTPLIVFESLTGPNGRIYTKDGHIDTM